MMCGQFSFAHKGELHACLLGRAMFCLCILDILEKVLYFQKPCSGMQPVGNYNKIQWFVYPSYSQEFLLTFYFDLVGMRVIKTVQQMRDNVQ